MRQWSAYLYTPDNGCGAKTFNSLFRGEGNVDIAAGLQAAYYTLEPEFGLRAVRVAELRANSYENNGILYQTGWDAKGVDKDGSLNWIVCACLGEIPYVDVLPLPIELVDPLLDLGDKITILNS